MQDVQELRKRYFADGEKLMCETSVYRFDTQCVDRSWVKEVDPTTVPREVLESVGLTPPPEPEPEPEPDPLIEPEPPPPPPPKKRTPKS